MAEESMRINITIPKNMKEDWEKFAEAIGTSISGLVRLSVIDYKKRYIKESTPITTNQDLITKQKQDLEAQINTRLDEFNKVLKQITPAKITEDTKDRLKAQITLILTDFPNGLEPKKLAAYCGIDRELMGDMLKEFNELGLTVMKRNLVVLKKE
jgi:hypothetical protein